MTTRVKGHWEHVGGCRRTEGAVSPLRHFLFFAIYQFCDCTHNFTAAAGLLFLFGAATLLFP